MIHTTTNNGLRDYVGSRVLSRYAKPGARGADLGAGPGLMALKLKSLGGEVVAVDRNANGFEADLPHGSPIFLDLLQRQFLPLAGVRLRERLVFPPSGYQLIRKAIVLALRMASTVFSEKVLHGDNNIFVIERRP